MPPYDSDSSADEDGDYTETSTLLGYSSTEPTDDTVSQLGGHPIWLDDKVTPSASLAKCKVCNGLLTLLLQLNGDLPDRFPGHERRLYIFHCRRKACRRKEGSIRGIRANRVTKSIASVSEAAATSPVEKIGPSVNIGATLFGGNTQGGVSPSTNPFSTGASSGTNPFSASSANPFAAVNSLAAKPAQRPNSANTLSETFASKARISESSPPPDPSFKPTTAPSSEPYEPWPPESAFPSPYPKTYLDADYETLSTPNTPQIPQVNPDIDADMGGTSGGMEQLFESSMDKTFQKFADRLAQNPEQVLRYEFGGQPLLYSTTDTIGKLLSPASESSAKFRTVSSSGTKLPRCANCGANRVFELQLTPYAITVLEEEDISLEGMDWGTAVLGVCEKDCGRAEKDGSEVAYFEEWVGVQWEELEETKRR